MQFNGVVLLSSILNYGVRDAGFDQLYITLLPGYAATAWYHNRVANRPADLETFLRQARDFARGPYAAALAKGDLISPAEQDAVARQMSALIGISPQVLKQSDLRLDLGRFRKELLRDQRRTVGRLDSRFTGIDVDAGGESPEYDPADTGVSGAFVGAFNSYIRNELGFWSELHYRPTYYTVGPLWDWKHRPPGAQRPSSVADTALDLSAAMRQNPSLKVYSLNGYYDLATPFFGAEYDLAHMQLDPQLRPNLRFAYYPSGHMVYLHEDSLRQMKADLARFYDETVGR
jgi:carboxypeptidase C (cathepsin A)